jgi:Holliday junction resolvase RusA-like endonuclease
VLILALQTSMTTTTCKTGVVLQALEANGGADSFDMVLFPVEPAPASRPRVAKFGVHYSKAHTAFVRKATPYAKTHEGLYIPTGPVLVVVEFCSTKARTSKLHTPNYDIDNAVKLPLDVMTASGRFWKDDKQVAELVAGKRFKTPDEDPCVIVYYKQL